MSWLCWNVRGLGNLHTLRELEVVTRAQDPAAMFLAEMWAEEARLHRLCFNMKFDHCWVGPSAGKTRCLVLLWKNSVHVEVVSSSPNHINTLVGVNPVDQWRFTRVYGYANSTRKQEPGLFFAAYTISTLSLGYAPVISTSFFGLMKSLALVLDRIVR